MKSPLFYILIILFWGSLSYAQEDEPQLLKQARLGKHEDITYSYEIYTLRTFSFLQVDVYLKAESKKKHLNVSYLGAGGRMDKPAELFFKDGIIKVDSFKRENSNETSEEPRYSVTSTCYHLNKKKTHFRETSCLGKFNRKKK